MRELLFAEHLWRVYYLIAARIDRFHDHRVLADLGEDDQLLEVAARLDVDFLFIDEHRRSRLGVSFGDVEAPADRLRTFERQRRRSRVGRVDASGAGRVAAAADAEAAE